MPKIISTISLSKYVLNAGGNPLSITTTGGVTTNGGTAIYGGSSQAWTITNAGTVSGGLPTGSIGIDLKAGGTIDNTGGIDGSLYAVRIHGATGLVSNAGSITSHGDGVVLFAGGSVSNAAAGVIRGNTNIGIYILGGAGTVTNAGTIRGMLAAVRFFGAFADRVIDDPGSVFFGNVMGGSGDNTLELGAGTSGATGTLSGFATSFTGFGTIAVDSGATWQLGSTNTIGGGVSLTDSGTLSNSGLINTTVTVAGGGSLGNTGTIVVGVGQQYYGVTLLAGGVVSNTGTRALIQGDRYGVRANGAAGTVTNGGIIRGGSTNDGSGIGLYAGGTVINTGTIIGSGVSNGYLGVYVSGGRGTVTNGGTIFGGYAVGMYNGGVVTNTGLIDGENQYGVIIKGGAATVTNAGIIDGGIYAVKFIGDYVDQVIIDPGAMFNGKVAGGSGGNTLELASGTAGATGTLSGFAAEFIGFGAITVDSFASWQLDGTDIIDGTVVLTDMGTLGNPTLIETTVTIAGGGSLDNTGTIDAGSAPFGVTLSTGGVVSNSGAQALIKGDRYGIRADGASATVTNGGTILGTSSSDGGGVGLYAGGTVTNTGTIGGAGAAAGYFGVYVNGGIGAVTNGGTIFDGYGIGLYDGGTVSNTGSINGSTKDGIYIRGGAGTITNAGAIGGALAAVRFSGAFTDRLIIDPGAVFNGKVVGGSGGNTLELAPGTAGAAGTLSKLPVSFVGFETIAVDGSAIWQLDNTDTISGGVALTDAGTLGNAGIIETTVTVAGGGSLGNTGTINAGGSQFGATLLAGGVVSNTDAAGLIQGTRYGIRAAGALATVTNSGTIRGTHGGGVGLYAGGAVTNTNTGTITSENATLYGVYIDGAGTVTNAGTISGNWGVGLSGGGVVNNTGSIDGSIQHGIVIRGGAGTVANAGTITGAIDAVRFLGAFADRVIIEPGAVFHGNVVGGSGGNTLELAADTAGSTGTLSGFATSFVGFGTITVDSSAKWQLDSTDTIDGGVTVADAGALLFSEPAGASVPVAAAISGSGNVAQTGGGTLVLQGDDTYTGGTTIIAGTLELSSGNAAGNNAIDFDGRATLRLDGAVMPTGTISGLVRGDQIDLAGISFANGGTASVVGGNTLRVIENSATYDLTLDPNQDFSRFAFPMTKDATNDTLLTVHAACYCQGTRILTTRGEIPVEHLLVGDRVLTPTGRPRPVCWIGRRHLDLARHPAPDRIRPIRIRAGAFADNVPHRDLLLSPDHAVLRDGVLVMARLLLNGASIVHDMRHRSVTYYHVELETHDLLLAEGLAAESYLDTGNRGMFENADGAIVLHPCLTNDQTRREAGSCAPFADDPARTEPIWHALAERAVRLGWQLPPRPEMTADPALRLRVGTRSLAPVSVTRSRYSFIVPRADTAVRLVSRSAVQTETAPWISDDRGLGVLLGGLIVRTGDLVMPIPLDHPDLGEGWWQPEWHGPATLRRWTNGDAVVPMPAPSELGSRLLEVEIAGTVPYLLSAADRHSPCLERIRQHR